MLGSLLSNPKMYVHFKLLLSINFVCEALVFTSLIQMKGKKSQSKILKLREIAFLDSHFIC